MGLSYSTPLTTVNYDWKPDFPDPRDHYHKYTGSKTKIPVNHDLREKMKEYEVDSTKSSIYNNIETVLKMYDYQYNIPDQYHQTTSIRELLKGVKIQKMESYTDDNGELLSKKVEKGLEYRKLHNYKNQIKAALLQNLPVVFGLTAFSSLEKPELKEIVNPGDDDTILGGTSCLVVGYDDKESHFIIKHNFGEKIGENGYFYMPYDVISKTNHLTQDFWIILRK